MISAQTLKHLRCPLDPLHTRLESATDALVCQRCRLLFPFKEGILSLVPEDATLPAGCTSLAELPCQTKEPAR